MAKQNLQKWVVILDKYPRGPFSEDEIQQLIEQKHLRRNDLAMLIPSDPQERSDWKFIWQFSQFDLRHKEPEKAPPIAVLEKRKPRSDGQIKVEAEDKIPLDLRSIQIEDLIVKVNTAPKKEFHFENRPEKTTAEKPFKDSALASKVGSGFFVILALGAMLGVGWREVKKIRSDSTKSVVQEQLGKDGSPAKGTANPSKRAALVPKKRVDGSEAVAPVLPVAPAKGDRKISAEAIPSARDRGEIREEEVLRAREEERRRELDEKERRVREEEEERKREESGEEENTENRKKKAKRVPNEEDNDNENAVELAPEPGDTGSGNSVLEE